MEMMKLIKNEKNKTDKGKSLSAYSYLLTPEYFKKFLKLWWHIF